MARADSELERLVDRLVDEALHDVLAPGLQRSLAEPPAEPLGAGEPYALDLDGVTVQHRDPCLDEDGLYLLYLPGLIVVVAQYADDGRVLRGRHLLRKNPRLLGETQVRQVAAENDDLGRARHGREERLETALGAFLAMQITDGCYSHGRPPSDR